MVVPTTCCGRSGGECVCAAQAMCSCGKQSALHCTCEKATTENVLAGPRCSCSMSPSPFFHSHLSPLPPHLRVLSSHHQPLPSFPPQTLLIFSGGSIRLTSLLGARPAGQCTCERATTENNLTAGSTCACGARPAGGFLVPEFSI
jgi:hypothetical protein